jgi:hypothetical protein
VELGPLHNRVNDTLAAVADEGNRILAATLEGKDQGSRCYRDYDAESGRQRNAYGKTTRAPS